MTKVKLLALAATLLVFLLLSNSPAFAAVTSMYLSPEWQEVELNQTFNVDIALNNSDSTEFDTILSWISFDPNILEVQDANPGVSGIQIESDPLGIFSFTQQWANTVNNTTGYIDLEESYSAGGTSTQTGVFARITFKAINVIPSTNIDFNFKSWGETPTTAVIRSYNDVLLSSSDNMDGVIGASVGVAGSPIPETNSIISLGSGLVGILVFMRINIKRSV